MVIIFELCEDWQIFSSDQTDDILHNTNLFFKKIDVKSLQSWTFYMSAFHLSS